MLRHISIVVALMLIPSLSLADTCATAQNISTVQRVVDTTETQAFLGHFKFAGGNFYCHDDPRTGVPANDFRLCHAYEADPLAVPLVKSPFTNYAAWIGTEIITRGITDLTFKKHRKACGTTWFIIDAIYVPILVSNARVVGAQIKFKLRFK